MGAYSTADYCRNHFNSSWPGIAVRRTASLLLAYVPAIHALAAARKKDVDARDKRGHDVEKAVRPY
jgi:hypothetical protein